jgi:hypothetical protein
MSAGLLNLSARGYKLSGRKLNVRGGELNVAAWS